MRSTQLAADHLRVQAPILGVAVLLSVICAVQVTSSPRPLLVCLAVLVVGAFAPWLLQDPRRTFLVMVFLLPFRGWFYFEVGVGLTGGKLVATLLLVQLLLVALVHGRSFSIRLSRSDLFLLLFSALVVVLWPMGMYQAAQQQTQGLWATRGPFTRPTSQVINLMIMVFIYFATAKVAGKGSGLERIIRVVFASYSFVTLYGLYQFIATPLSLPFNYLRMARRMDIPMASENVVRILSTMEEPKNLAHVLIPTIFLFLTLRLSRTGPLSRGRFQAVMLVLFGFVFLATFSRSGWILMALSLVLFVLFRGTGRASWRVIGLVLAVAAAVVVFSTTIPRADLYTAIENRLEVTTWEDWRRSIEYDITLAALKVGGEHPILGVGLGNHAFYFRQSATYPHYVGPGAFNPFCAWILLFEETGIVGLSLFMVFAIGTLRNARWRLARTPQPYERALGTALFFAALAIFVVHFYSADLHRPYLWFWFGLLRGWMMRAEGQPGTPLAGSERA